MREELENLLKEAKASYSKAHKAYRAAIDAKNEAHAAAREACEAASVAQKRMDGYQKAVDALPAEDDEAAA